MYTRWRSPVSSSSSRVAFSLSPITLYHRSRSREISETTVYRASAGRHDRAQVMVAVQLRDKLQNNRATVMALFRRWDLNGDGVLSVDEFNSVYKLVVTRALGHAPKVVDQVRKEHQELLRKQQQAQKRSLALEAAVEARREREEEATRARLLLLPPR